MGKKRISILGSADEEALKKERVIKLEQKKLREGKKTGKAPGLGGGQRVVDTTTESLAEYEEIQKRSEAPTPQEKAPPKKIKIKIRSSAYKTAKTKVDTDKTYSINDACTLLKQINLTKFDPTVELHITLKSGSFSQTVQLPYSAGKIRKIAVADDKTISQIEAGKIDFDLLITSPAQMPKLVKLAKILGPKGLMPNPKNNTIVPDPEAEARRLSASSSLMLKTEKSAPLIHTIIGKLSQKESELIKNAQTVISALPPGNVRKIVIKSTMSPAIKITL